MRQQFGTYFNAWVKLAFYQTDNLKPKETTARQLTTSHAGSADLPSSFLVEVRSTVGALRNTVAGGDVRAPRQTVALHLLSFVRFPSSLLQGDNRIRFDSLKNLSRSSEPVDEDTLQIWIRSQSKMDATVVGA